MLAFSTEPAASVRGLEDGLADRQNGPVDHEVVARIADAYAAAVRDQPAAARPYRLGWKYAEENTIVIETAYESALRSGDVSGLAAEFDGFLRDIPIGGLLEYATYQDVTGRGLESAIRRRRFVLSVLHDLRVWNENVNGDVADLTPAPPGNPWGYMVQSTVVGGAAPRHDYYAAAVGRLLDGTSKPRVAEIGGGYGGFAFYLSRRVPDVTYLDFDLPEVVALASYYLLSTFPDGRTLLYGEGALTEEAMNDNDLILMPNFALADLPPLSVDGFVNSASMSEMHRETVDRYLTDIGRTARSFFLNDNSDTAQQVGTTSEVPSLSFTYPPGFAIVRERPSPWRSAARCTERIVVRQ